MQGEGRISSNLGETEGKEERDVCWKEEQKEKRDKGEDDDDDEENAFEGYRRSRLVKTRIQERGRKRERSKSEETTWRCAVD